MLHVLVAAVGLVGRAPRETRLSLTNEIACGRQDSNPLVVNVIAGGTVHVPTSPFPTWTFTQVHPALVTVQACNDATCRWFVLHPLVPGCTFVEGLDITIFYAGRAGRWIRPTPPRPLTVKTVVGGIIGVTVLIYFVWCGARQRSYIAVAYFNNGTIREHGYIDV